VCEDKTNQWVEGMQTAKYRDRLENVIVVRTAVNRP
jgi:hypothetical protein